MRTKDQLKLEIIFKLHKGELGRKEAAKMLGITERSVGRNLRAYRERGIGFIRHGNTGRAPVNKIHGELQGHVLGLIQQKYFDFNIRHIQDCLREEIGHTIPYTTLRRWCHSINMVKHSRKKRRSKPRRARQRMSQQGYLLQLDGSHHHWFGGRFLCLMAAIDDATGEVFAKFYEGETTWACMDFLKELVLKKGVMRFVYTDRAGLYGGIKREHFSQVERALGELGAHVIYAQSPEGKGRVERLFRTLQDRLVAELRLNGVGSLEEANDYLNNVFLPHKFNPQFMVKAENPISGYRPLAANTDLDTIFCIKETRIIGKDHTVSVNAEKWMIADDIRYSIAKRKLELRFDKWGEWTAYFAGQPIRLIKIQKDQKIA